MENTKYFQLSKTKTTDNKIFFLKEGLIHVALSFFYTLFNHTTTLKRRENKLKYGLEILFIHDWLNRYFMLD